MRCCFNSVDENNYSRISVTIPPLSGCKYTAVRCDSFVCNCNIRVLNNRDYLMMTVGDTPFTVRFEDYTNLNAETFVDLLNGKMSEAYEVNVALDNCNRIYFSAKNRFVINDLTYNVKLLLGLYSMKDEDIKAQKLVSEPYNEETFRLQIKSVGIYLSTPVLNLVSNIGDASLRNNSDDIGNIQSCNAVLRINNSFSYNVPIIAGGDGNASIIPSGRVCGAVFILVDANMRQVDLLNPMYISLTLEPLNGYDLV